MPTNNIVLNPQRGDAVAITAISNGYSQTNAQFGTTGFATVTGTFPNGASNGLIQQAITISGFSNSKNNGTFQILSSTATQLTVNNPFAVAQSGATALGTFESVGFPSQVASKIDNMWSNQTGDFCTVNASAGDTLVAVVIGLRQIVNFDQLHGTAPYYPQYGDSAGTSGDYPDGGFPLGWLAGLNDYNASPVISDYANGAPVDIVSTSVTSNVITVTYSNPNPVSASLTQASYFTATQSVTLSGTQESAVNGQTVVVATATAATFERLVNGQIVQKTPASFTAPLTTPNYSNADDTGKAAPAGNTWASVGNSMIIDSDYTVTYPFSGPLDNGSVTPSVWNGQLAKTASGGLYAYGSNLYTTLTPSNAYQSATWNIDGYFPSIYIFVANDVAAGTYKVSLDSMFQSGDGSMQWSEGSAPIFDGGVNFQVFCVSGADGVDASSFPAVQGGDTRSNPATAPATLTTTAADGDLLLSVGLMKSNNVMQPGSVGGTATALTLTAVAPLNYGPPQFAEQNYGGAVYTGTITGGANNAFAGYTFTVAGFPAVAGGSNNGTFTCTASTATTLTLNNGEAVAATHAGTASYTALMARLSNGKLVGSEAHYMIEYALTAPGSAGTFNPGFQNPLGYGMLVASVAIKSS